MDNKNEKKVEAVVATAPRKQKVSVTYTLRALGENIKKLAELGLISEEDRLKMATINLKAFTKYVTGTDISERDLL